MAKKSLDPKIIKKLQAGDNSAFNDVYNYYKDSLYYFALSLVKNPSDAEEVVQDTFVSVLKNINSLQKPSSFTSWINSILYSTAMQLYRKNNKYVQLEEEYNLENIIEGKDNTTEMLHRKELVEVVQKEIDNLPDKFKQVAKLRYFDNLSVKEIADVMDIPEGTVKNRLNRIRETIKPTLKAKGYTPVKYFSFTIAPIMAIAFANLINEAPMSVETSERIFHSVAETAGITVGSYSLASSALNYNRKTKNAIRAAGMAVVSVACVSAGYYYFNDIGSVNIEKVEYNVELTNQDIDVDVTLDGKTTTNSISVKKDNQNIEFKLNDNVVSFKAVNNGLYTINVDDHTRSIDIKNIDKDKPVLSQNVTYENNVLYLPISDEKSGIDYEKSYIEYKGEKYLINEDDTVTAEFNGELKAFIYDKIGNIGEYKITINK